MKSYKIVGIDFSLTSPGVSCMEVYEDLSYKFIDFDNVKTTSNENWFDRLNKVQTMVLDFVRKHKPHHISIENYSFGSTNGRETAGEVHGSVLFKLFECGFPPQNVFRDISPNARAKFFTGNGRAKKEEVVPAVNEALSFDFTLKDNDIVDSIIVAYIRYCINHYTQLEPKLNKAQKEVIKKILENKTKIKPFGGN